MDGKALKYKILESGFSVQEIADKAGMKANNISGAFKSANLTTGILEKIAEAINKPISWFYEEFPEISMKQYKELINAKGYDLDSISNGMGIPKSTLLYRTQYHVPYYVIEQTAVIMQVPIEYFYGNDDTSSVNDKELIQRLQSTIATQSQIINKQTQAIAQMGDTLAYLSDSVGNYNIRLARITDELIKRFGDQLNLTTG